MARAPESLYRPVPEYNPSHRAVQTKPAKTPKPMTFEQAMKLLRAHKPVRRRSWHSNSFIFRLQENVFVQLPGKEPNMDTIGTQYHRAPDIWRPYPADFLATDWEKA